MRILFLVESIDGPSTRYRVAPLASAARWRGHHVEVAAAEKGGAARRRCCGAARASDLVVLQRRLWPLTSVGALRRAARVLVYDIDDAVCFADGARGRFSSVGRWLKFRALCRAADAVTAGNAYLAALAARFGARRVERLPTVLPDAEIAAGPAQPRSGPLRTVWLGGTSTKRYLRAWLDSLGGTLPARCELRVIADETTGPHLPRVSYRRYDPAHVDAWLRECHVGLAPLPDDPWTRGKCALKVLQYAARALPTIASPVGVQRELVADGRTGFLATTTDEWRERLEQLERDEPLRRRLGAQARDEVAAGYTWSRWGERWLDYLEALR